MRWLPGALGGMEARPNANEVQRIEHKNQENQICYYFQEVILDQK